MRIQTTREFALPANARVESKQTIRVKLYPQCVGWILSKINQAQVFVGEDQTYYLSNKTKNKLCNKVLKHLGMQSLPTGCQDKIAFQICAEAIFNPKETRHNQLRQPAKEVLLNDRALESMNAISPVPVVRRNDIIWVREHIKPGAILIVHAHENFKPTTAIITGAQGLVRHSSVDPRDTRAMHTLVCVGPGKFAEATPSKTGDQVRIIDFNQSYHDLPIGSNAEFQVYEPNYEEMEPLERDAWEKRFGEMVRIAKDYAVSNTGIDIDDPTYAEHIDRSFEPKSVIESKLKYGHFDALFSILKFGHFSRSARIRVFEEIATQALALETPYTGKGKRGFICSSFNAWLLQSMQHGDLLTILKGNLAAKGKTLGLPEMREVKAMSTKPELEDLKGKSRAEKKSAKKDFKAAKRAYCRDVYEIRKNERYNGNQIRKWAKKMHKDHAKILWENLEFKVNARYCNPMDVKDLVRKRPDVFRLKARIVPARVAQDPIKV